MHTTRPEAQENGPRKLLPLFGAILLGAGLFLLFLHLDELNARFFHFAVGTATEFGGSIFPAMVITAQHVVHSWFFDRPSLLSEARQILLLFWPLVLVVSGGTLLRAKIGQMMMAKPTDSSAAEGRR